MKPIDWTKVLRFIPEDKQSQVCGIIESYYLDLMEDDWPVEYKSTCIRWKKLTLVDWTPDTNASVDYNRYYVDTLKGHVTRWEYRASMRASGYSLAGYADLSLVQDWLATKEKSDETN